jgi:hypothetical protein
MANQRRRNRNQRSRNRNEGSRTPIPRSRNTPLATLLAPLLARSFGEQAVADVAEEGPTASLILHRCEASPGEKQRYH